MKLEELKTLMGLTLKELATKLDEQLPDAAYKAITASRGRDGNELTDIDPNYMNQVLEQCFGLAGVGHGFTYQPTDLHVENTGQDGMKGWVAYLTQGTFWYKLIDAAGAETLISIQHSGGSMNSRPDFASKGALTSALAGAASKIGFQKSVYLGLRSHKTVGKRVVSETGKGVSSVTTSTCALHKVPMRQYPNGKIAHQLSDKSWCFGVAPTSTVQSDKPGNHAPVSSAPSTTGPKSNTASPTKPGSPIAPKSASATSVKAA